MKRSTKPDDIRPPLDELQRAAREVGEALARARGRDPQSFFHGLPSWYSMLPWRSLRSSLVMTRSGHRSLPTTA